MRLKIIVLTLFSAIAVTGCFKNTTSSKLTNPAAKSSEAYEKYEENAILAQNEFQDLTEHFFQEQIIRSTLSLHYTAADPASLGITEYPVTLGHFSVEESKKQETEFTALSEKLSSINEQYLTDDQKVLYSILKYQAHLSDLSKNLELYQEPLKPTTGLQCQLPVLLSEYPFYSKKDVEDYLSLLKQYDNFFNEIIEFEKQKSEAGLFMGDESVNHVIRSCDGYLLAAEHNFMTETFNDRVNAITDLSEEEKKDFKSQNLSAIKEHFIPAYHDLIKSLNELKGTGSEGGLSRLPSGQKYYEYLIKNSIGITSGSIDDLKKEIEKQLDADCTEITQINSRNPAAMEQISSYSFKVNTPDDILANLKENLAKNFPEISDCSYEVKNVPKALERSLSPAFYILSPIDRLNENIIYINGSDQYKDSDLYTILAHEGYPGHLYQHVYFYSKKPSILRSLLPSTGYNEGWATYASSCAYQFDNGLEKDVAALLSKNNTASMAIRCLLDININYNNWDKNAAQSYLSKYFNISDPGIIDDIYYSVIEDPGSYLNYYVGYLEIMKMKNTAAEKLKDRFSEKDFNQFLLEIGPAPFSIIEPYFNAWLLEQNLRKN